jgi:HlyD family secretion protein
VPKRTLAIVIIVAVIALGAIIGARAVFVSVRAARNPAAGYSTARVTLGVLDVSVTGTGVLAPKAHQDCLISTGGRVTSVLVQPGRPVDAGQTLLVLTNDSLVDQVDQARLDHRLVQMELDGMTKPGGGVATAADVLTARAAAENARLSVRRAQDNVAALVVRAPFAGRVWGLGARGGDEVPAGAVLLTVSAYADVRAILSAPEGTVKHLAIGQTVAVSVSALGRDFGGRITAIGAQGAADNRGQVFYPVTVTLSDSDPQLRGGMSVTARLPNGPAYPGDTLTAGGLLAYGQTRAVITATGGKVATLAIGENDLVDRDQVLMTLTSEEAEIALLAAQAELARAEERLDQLTGPLPSSYPLAQLEKQRLRVEQAALRLRGLERQLAELTVKASLSGTLTELPVSVGDQVPPNTRVATVADLGRVVAVVTVDELQVARLAIGQTATVRLDALPGETFPAILESLSMEGLLRDGVTSYEARIAFTGDSRLRGGMSLSVQIQVARRENALLVPVEAVYGAGAEASVQVLVDGRPLARPVVAGLSNNAFAEILDGLAEGETVITGSLQADNSPFGPMGRHGAGSGDSGTAPGESSGGD